MYIAKHASNSVLLLTTHLSALNLLSIFLQSLTFSISSNKIPKILKCVFLDFLEVLVKAVLSSAAYAIRYQHCDVTAAQLKWFSPLN